MRDVIILGVYRTDTPNTLDHLKQEFFGTSQVWTHAYAPKFTVLNHLLAQIHVEDWQYVIICDDDIYLPPNFLTEYMRIVRKENLALAQPARTAGSSIHHPIVKQQPGVCRVTRFVEIGPVFSVRRDLFGVLFPFDERSPMGWGYDYVWPLQVEAAGLRMGIVDATPVAHTLRPGISYDMAVVNAQMHGYLAHHPHVFGTDRLDV